MGETTLGAEVVIQRLAHRAALEGMIDLHEGLAWCGVGRYARAAGHFALGAARLAFALSLPAPPDPWDVRSDPRWPLAERIALRHPISTLDAFLMLRRIDRLRTWSDEAAERCVAERIEWNQARGREVWS